jgi:RNA polymerase primary sigma factor
MGKISLLQMERKSILKSRKSALSDYMRSLYAIPVLTRQEERLLGAQIQAGDEDALEKLVTHNLRFAVSVIKKNPHWAHSNVDMEDMLGFANEELFRAAKKWKAQGNIRFATYAKRFIILGVNRGVANTKNIIRLPVNIMEEIRRTKYTERMLTQALQREPSVKELADKLGVPVDQVLRLNTILAKEPISLEIFNTEHLKDDNYEN